MKLKLGTVSPKMVQNEIEEMLDHLRWIKNGGNLSSNKIKRIEKLEVVLRVFRTFIEYHHVDLLHDSLVELTKKAKSTVEMLQRVLDGIPDECKTNLNLERLESHLLKFFQGNTSLSDNNKLNGFDLSKYMDCLRKNLNDVLVMLLEGVRFFPPEENLEIHKFIKQLEIVQKKLKFLIYLYATEIKGYVNHEKLECLETRMHFMANNVGQLCLAISGYIVSNFVDDKDEDEYEYDILNKPPYLLFLIVLVELEMKKIFRSELKASKFTHSRTFKDRKLPKGFSHHFHSLLMFLRNKNVENFPNYSTAQNIYVAIIEFLVVFLEADVSNHVINGNWLNEAMEKVGAIVGDILCAIQKVLPRSINKDDTRKMSLWSIHILKKTKDLKTQVETYYKSLKFTPSQFPTVGGWSFLDSLIRKLNEMSKSKSGLDFLMKPLLGNLEKELSALTSILEKDLSSLSSIFRKVAKVHHENEILHDLHRRTINLAYEAEVAIDSILAQYNVFWHIFCSLPTISKEIKQINAHVTEICSTDVALKPCYVVAPFKHISTRHINPMTDEEIVGFGNDTEKMIQYLIRGTNELDVIPIVGMGGQGKTTIARKVYNSDNIVSHFDVRAWCIVSQTYNRRTLLQEIFSQVTGSKDKGDKDDILADMLRKSLMGKRYLIILDDMWDCMEWDDLRLCFPDVGNRSRIVVTTRLEKVGEQVTCHTDPYSLPFLTTEESCKLLQKKVFQEEDCLPELQDVSQAVAEKCKGLPLVVVLVAGIIKKRKMEESWWNEVKDALFDCLDRESEEYSLVTMQLSFDNLPDYLKPCLLYMGMFSEDTRIPASKLISLWIAEGFVENTESAEDYLMDLISSNVVMVSKKEYNGKVKYCQVHDVVLHFCLEKSRKEKFMLAVKGNRSQFQPCDWKERRVRFNQTRNPKHRSLVNGRIVQEHFNFASLRSKTWKPCDWKESRPNPKHGNLVIGRKVKEHSKFASLGSKTRKPFHQPLRSLITNGEYFDGIPFFQVHKLQLLKVLDLSSHRVNSLSLASFKPLNHLKYLAVSAYRFYFHPESHLPHLETLIVKSNAMVLLPASFWEMEKLRYVEIRKAEFDKQGLIEGTSKLENLRILKNIFRFPIDSVDVLSRRCPNLQQLHIRFGDDNCSAESFCLTLKNLSQLQKLHLTSKWRRTVFGLQLPSNLKMLVLSRTDIGNLIAGLQSLEYLQLQDVYFPPSEEWCLGDITFPKLKVLKLAASHILKWEISEESFPLLETLVIRGCKNLEEIPLSFADIPTLKQIKLIDCNKSLEDSAERIKKDVEENEGNDCIDLIIENYN